MNDDKDSTGLNHQQQVFAEWLSQPSFERHPKTQVELAQLLGVSEATLCNWKKIPEVLEYRNSILAGSGKDLVPEAVGALKGMLRSNSNQVVLKAAQEILDRWGESSGQSLVITSLKDVWDKHEKDMKPTKIKCPHCGKEIKL
jgi:hypothetical protein